MRMRREREGGIWGRLRASAGGGAPQTTEGAGLQEAAKELEPALSPPPAHCSLGHPLLPSALLCYTCAVPCCLHGHKPELPLLRRAGFLSGLSY